MMENLLIIRSDWCDLFFVFFCHFLLYNIPLYFIFMWKSRGGKPKMVWNDVVYKDLGTLYLLVNVSGWLAHFSPLRSKLGFLYLLFFWSTLLFTSYAVAELFYSYTDNCWDLQFWYCFRCFWGFPIFLFLVFFHYFSFMAQCSRLSWPCQHLSSL